MLEVGDKLVIGGGMIREILSIRLSAKTNEVVVWDTTTLRCEKLRLAQLLKYSECGWVEVRRKEA